MFRPIRSTLAVLLLPAFLVACASSPSVKTTAEQAPVARMYTTAYIGKISTTLVDDTNPDESRLTDKKKLDAKIPAVLKEELEDNGFAVPAAMPANKAGAVVINLEFQYNPGNRALRWTAGIFGAGKGILNGKIEALDVTTGALIATRSGSDATRMGAFGGDFYGSVEDMVEELAEELAEELNAKGK
ncbi:DUF4410 domain-containing protein [Hydrogenophaga sp. PAMC20947]|uniref:DUF4410 domain-containing protein n=1 Tax=Hydrogenophaga sp. PAMC20947 TaxID=2565558 RepID=UPI00109E03BB|nr:DUF4410 domain-containing protein [Hydrogenophaga sp. PAMC20947]QCB46308.1 DUF4410 domain-containing protein [Hydrogenophaga sp. PAMC20947]